LEEKHRKRHDRTHFSGGNATISRHRKRKKRPESKSKEGSVKRSLEKNPPVTPQFIITIKYLTTREGSEKGPLSMVKRLASGGGSP